MAPIARIGWLLLLLAAARGASAAADVPYTWRNVVVGGGGFAPNIIFSRVEKRLAYLRIDMGGAYRWDLQVERWIPLQDAMAEGSYMGVESLAADPRDANVVYLAAGMYFRDPAAILRSSDRGRTWSITPVPFRMGGNEEGRGIGERLAIDPNRTSTLLFGSRHDGLQRSDDSGRSWRKVASFPWAGLGPPGPGKTHAGVAFVLFDPASGAAGGGSRIIYAAVADPAANHLFRSVDNGRSWQAVPGGPAPGLLPVKAALDRLGTLYVDYATSIGPNDVAGGAVWKLDTRSGRWTDITPARGANAEGGYMGLSVDRMRPGRIAVSTVDRWRRGDTIWLSNDGGAHWISLRETSRRDISASPFLGFGQGEADFGHWMAGLAFDPFDGRTLAYTTGATVYRTDDARNWKPWVAGIEQTAIITLMSPSAGPPLVSGFGDIAGFVHERLDRSPALQLVNPPATNTNNLDYAGLAPNLLVRSFWLRNAPPRSVSLAWSANAGRLWNPLQPPGSGFKGGDAPIAVSADGSTFFVSGPAVLATSDRGRRWWRPVGLPPKSRVVTDKADPRLVYAADDAGRRLFVSRDGGHSFTPATALGLPRDWSSSVPRNRESPSSLLATPGVAGELWLLADGRLYRSRDAGAWFASSSDPALRILLFGLGKGLPGSASPALYAFGEMRGLRAIWRSVDAGKSWRRINDDAHQWGLRIRVVTGDPRRFGRVYLGTDGRGIIYGDPVPAKALR